MTTTISERVLLTKGCLGLAIEIWAVIDNQLGNKFNKFFVSLLYEWQEILAINLLCEF